MKHKCIVDSCRSSPAEATFFSCPKVTFNKLNKSQPNLISVRRLEAWRKALELPSDFNFRSWKICSRHFVSERPAKKMDMYEVDWVPTLHLGPHRDCTSKGLLEEDVIQMNEEDVTKEDEDKEYSAEEILYEDEVMEALSTLSPSPVAVVEHEDVLKQSSDYFTVHKKPKLLNSEVLNSMPTYTEVITLPFAEDDHCYEQAVEEAPELADKMCQTDLTSEDIELFIEFFRSRTNS